MKKHAEPDVIAASTLNDVCQTVLDRSIGNNGQALDVGEFLSDDDRRDVLETVHLAIPGMPITDAREMANGICFGLAAAMRYIEAKQQEADRKLVPTTTR